MRYTPPPGSTDPDAPYVTGQPGVRRGSPVPAEAVEDPQREIVKVITEAGLTPDNDDLTQLWQAIQIIVNRSSGIKYAACATPGATLTKAVTVPGLGTGAGSTLNILFDEVNSVASPLLSVNDGPGRPIIWQGMPPEVGDLARGQVYQLVSTGDAWQILAGMAPWRIGQIEWWEDELSRPGFVPCNGATIVGVSAKYPQIMAYLNTTHGLARRFASLADYNAAHVAIWATLASGATVGWDGLGGVTKFYWDEATDTLYLPDLRGMFRAVAGDGVVAPSMGGAMGDRGREGTGWFRQLNYAYMDAEGVFSSSSNQGTTNIGGGGNYNIKNINFYLSRVQPTGPTFVPRSWGALACVYLGAPAMA